MKYNWEDFKKEVETLKIDKFRKRIEIEVNKVYDQEASVDEVVNNIIKIFEI